MELPEGPTAPTETNGIAVELLYSREVLERGLAPGYLPFLGLLLGHVNARGGWREGNLCLSQPMVRTRDSVLGK